MILAATVSSLGTLPVSKWEKGFDHSRAEELLRRRHHHSDSSRASKRPSMTPC